MMGRKTTPTDAWTSSDRMQDQDTDVQPEIRQPQSRHHVSDRPNPSDQLEASQNSNRIGPGLGQGHRSHRDLHDLEIARQRTEPPNRQTSSSQHVRRIDGVGHGRRGLGGLLGCFRAPHRPTHRSMSNSASTRRGRHRISELGRHANEDKMPPWLISLLQEERETRNGGIIPVLEQLLRLNEATQCAYLCDPSVQHISKLKKEGGFCGYRNIQMLASYIIGVGSAGHETFRGELPTIFEIQDYIEDAWNSGINPQGRVETGGIRGTRKYIGTAEAQAMLKGLAIPCTAHAYTRRESGKSEAKLLRDIEEYFCRGASPNHVEQEAKVVCTSLPPVYFQHKGHSMTIIGLEKKTDGSIHLLVFDPSRDDPPAVRQLVGQTIDHKNPDEALSPYRRGHKYLGRYKEFETLRLSHETAQPHC
ncbi:peptidase family C78-domain-containing protein [Plectosphaerella cucumerina]|uniref:Peptidase family C78-domain-containing protein n=1 Tax=Plectosphaerella cucumerina TaxID=40658 RepID=A0A8K0TMK3_9PEZI|nr:peptidase family C78-domain-containing protein [Plectosphaerella cucumerina]